MIYKKLILLNLLVFMGFQQGLMPAWASNEISQKKEAIRQASTRVYGRWIWDRAWPAAVGASMVAAPITVGFLGFASMVGQAGTATTNESNKYLWMGMGAYLVSCISVPLGMLLIKRQDLLIERDLGLLKKFTLSTNYLNAETLPDVARINEMTTYHELLSMAQDYIDQEGNSSEKFGKIWGLRGFTYQKIEKSVIRD